jgi:type II secretory pathway pseudopilin PulG
METSIGREHEQIVAVQHRRPLAGFTLIELVMIIVMLSIVSVYVVMNNVSPAAVTLPSQAQKMAVDIRHVQTLATTWGRSLRINTANNTYSVTCTSSVVAPCPSSTSTNVIDPATGSSFSVALQNGVSLAGPATLDFSSLGQPSAAASYALSFGGNTRTVCVAGVTGLVNVISSGACP